MKKIIGFLVFIILFAFIPFGPVDYSSKFSGLFIVIGNLQVYILDFISLIIISSGPIILLILNKISELLIVFSNFIINLPYHLINPWYVLILLFLISYFFEKFRFINNELNKLNKKILKKSSNSNNNQELLDNIQALTSKADSITNLLSQISKAADIFKSSHDRSKKIRRNESINIEKSDDVKEKQVKKKTKKKIAKKKTSKKIVKNDDSSKESMNNTSKEITDQPQTEEIINDENISKIDLVRALIDTNDKNKARELLEKIVETGSEEEKHEARLLYMQIK